MASLHNTIIPDRGWRAMFVDRVVIGAFVILSALIALGEFDVLPLGRVLALPAFAATVLVEITLSNYFFIDIRSVWWVVLAVFVYLQSVAIGLLYWLLQDSSLWRP